MSKPLRPSETPLLFPLAQESTRLPMTESRSAPPQKRFPRPEVAVLLAASVALYVFGLPFDWTNSSPLQWDQSSHYFQAIQFAEGIRGDSPTDLLAATRGSDQYPPGHTVALGAWFLAFGTDLASWITFGLVLFVGTTWLLARAGPAAALVFLVSPMLGGLAPSLMVEPISCALLATSIALFPMGTSEPVPVWRFVAFGLAAAATTLTKYNVGLPLIPAALIAALLTRDRRTIVGIAIAVTFAGACLALFLSWQDDGWSSFLRFAENRSNSADKTPWYRIEWYVGAFANLFVGSKVLAAVMGGLALIGGGWVLLRERPWSHGIRSARLALALAYVVGSMIALARHEYLLSRNLVSPTIVVLFAAGMFSESLAPVRRWVVVALIGALGLGVLLADEPPTRRSMVERYYPAKSNDLRDLSDALVARFDREKRTRVVGTFNDFSSGWVHVLRYRHARGARIGVGWPYPLERDRTGLSDAWSDEYRAIVDGWGRDGIDRVLAIEVVDGSPFESRDYELWSRWKRNLVRAAIESPYYRQVESITLRGEIELHVFDRVHRTSSER